MIQKKQIPKIWDKTVQSSYEPSWKNLNKSQQKQIMRFADRIERLVRVNQIAEILRKKIIRGRNRIDSEEASQ